MKFLQVIALTCAAALSACSSTNPYAAPQQKLAQQAARVEQGQLQEAARELEKLIVQADRSDAGARLQALYATQLLTQAHARASLGAPFLREPTAQTGLGGGAPRTAGVGHVVASSMYASLGRELAANVEKAPREHKGVKLLPPAFDGFEPKDARASLAVCEAIALVRLGFNERVREFVAGSTELQKYDSAKTLLDRLRIADGLRPWIYSAVFDFLRRSESTEPEAYKFAVQALMTSAQSGGAFDVRSREALASWIQSGSNFEYRCPEHRSLVQPELGRCQELGCQRALHEFTPQRKSR